MPCSRRYRGTTPMRWGALLVLGFLTHGCASSGAGVASTDPAASPSPAPVERLLEHSGLESIVTGRAAAFTRRVALAAGDLTDAELERLVAAVQAAFSPEALHADVAAFVAAEAAPGRIEEILAWHETGANAELGRLSDAFEPPTTLQEFTRSLVVEPPPGDRIALMVAWAEAQGAGDFFVLLDQALEEAAHTVWGRLRDDAPAFRPLSGDPLFARLETSFDAAVVTFLYRLQTVPDDVIRGATEEYGTEAGRWYVETYSLAVARAIRAAGHRVAAALVDG